MLTLLSYACIIIVALSLPVKYSTYYYENIQSKLDETTSLGLCRILLGAKNFVSDSHRDSYVATVEIPSEWNNRKYWTKLTHHSISSNVTALKRNGPYIGISDSLCNSVEYDKYVSKIFKLCSTNTTNRNSNRRSIARVSVLHPGHPRCSTALTQFVCRSSKSSSQRQGLISIPHTIKHYNRLVSGARVRPKSGYNFADIPLPLGELITPPFLISIDVSNVYSYNASEIPPWLYHNHYQYQDQYSASANGTWGKDENRKRKLYTTSNLMVSSTGMVFVPQCGAGQGGMVAFSGGCSAVKEAVPMALSEFSLVASAQNIEKSNSVSNFDYPVLKKSAHSHLKLLAEMSDSDAELMGADRSQRRHRNKMSMFDLNSLVGHASYHDRVLVLTQFDDNQIGQFILETLPRLIINLDQLQKHPDCMIHMGYGGVVDPRAMRYFDFLNISHKVVTGIVFTKHALLPREGACQDAVYNAAELLYMKQFMLSHVVANLIRGGRADHSNPHSPVSTVAPKQSSNILVIQRRKSDLASAKNKDGTRYWSDEFVQELSNALKAHPSFHSNSADIQFVLLPLFSDANRTLMECITCQVELFAMADIVIGVHGAGLTHSLYMKPGGFVFEIIPFFDSRHAPLVGIFPRLSQVIGIHHYSYYPSPEQERGGHRGRSIDTVHLTNCLYDFVFSILTL